VAAERVEETQARQADHRQMNMRVLLSSGIIVIVVIAVVYVEYLAGA